MGERAAIYAGIDEPNHLGKPFRGRFYLDTTLALFSQWLSVFVEETGGRLYFEKPGLGRPWYSLNLFEPDGWDFLDSQAQWRAYILDWDTLVELGQLGPSRLEVVIYGGEGVVWPDLAADIRARWGIQEPERTQAGAHADSGHFKYGPEDRRKIAGRFRQDRAAGKALNMEAWAVKYDIHRKTLKSYLDEFPEGET